VGQVHFDWRIIGLTKTQNSSVRDVCLNADTVVTLKSIYTESEKSGNTVSAQEETRFDTRSLFVPNLKVAECEGYVGNSNRHPLCSRPAMVGASIKEIQ